LGKSNKNSGLATQALHAFWAGHSHIFGISCIISVPTNGQCLSISHYSSFTAAFREMI